jgi:uncharacterized protein (DUF433 family)
MIPTARLYTPAEAAAVSGLALRAVNNVIDKRIVEVAKPSAAGKRSVRRYLTGSHLLCLRLEHSLAGRLPVDRRQGLFREVAAQPEAKMLKADDLLFVDVDAARRDVTARMLDLDEAERLIHSDKETLGGEPVFKGTRIPVYSIAAMLEAGASVDDLLSGYPKLDAHMLELGRLWAAAHPRRGRPKRLADYGFKVTSTSRRPMGGDPLAKAAVASKG